MDYGETGPVPSGAMTKPQLPASSLNPHGLPHGDWPVEGGGPLRPSFSKCGLRTGIAGTTWEGIWNAGFTLTPAQ